MAAAIGLACSLAGCANHSQRRSRAADWESEESIAARVAPQLPVPVPATPPNQAVASIPNAPPYKPAERHARFTETWVPLVRWCQSNALPTPVLQVAAPSPRFLLSSSEGALVVQAGSRVAHWKGLDLRLGFAPQTINAEPFVHTLDLAKTIEPLLLGQGSTKPAGSEPRVIVIDPGHGGENAGTRSVAGLHYEKEFTLDWARRLQRALENQGWKVLLTRTDDSDIAISNRVAFAQAHRAELFVSLHFNSASPDNHQAGLETYCLTPTGMPSTVTREFEDDPAEVLPNNAFDIENLRLALSVHAALLDVNGHQDRGVRRARFLGVLRGQERPAILIEGGYLSNPQEARRIAEPEYRQKLADAVARGLGVAN